ncbi:MAG: cadherin-like domain-containing protein [Phyllobacteriaceae bacterium]|nr:cadherin-like domain-containing protein [Phyllobacteriaceae bacterium]
MFDSWGNSTLQGIIAHDVLDNYYAEQNDWYNAWDGNTENNGDQGLAEGSFGLFENSATTGEITPKLAVGLIQAIVGGYDYYGNGVRILSVVTTDTVDISQWGTNGTGILTGYVVLTHGGNDSVSGSAFDDSIFAGDGDDFVDGNAGGDRIYGGSGNDFLFGEDGDDDLYGNTGDDSISGGAGNNRVDGGTGWDVLLLEGTAADFTISGDGAYLVVTAVGGWLSTVALNVEQVVFVADGSIFSLANADPTRGNGGVAGGSIGNSAPVAANDAGVIVSTGGMVTVNVLANDSDADGDLLTITHINGVALSADGWTGYIPGVGLVQRNADNTLTIHSLDSSPGPFSFTYTVSDGTSTDVATVNGTINAVVGSTIVGTSGVDYIDGTIGNDTILAGDGNDQLYGDLGNDILDGQGGAYDQVNYDGFASEYTFVQNADGSITVTNATYGIDTLLNIDGFWFFDEAAWYAASDLVVPAGGGATIVGTSGVDYIDGTIGNDTILAGDGNDQLYGDLGNDILDGQGGSYNQVNYDGFASEYTFVQNADGSVTVTNATYGTDTLLNIDGFWFFEEAAWYSVSSLV